MKKTISLLLCIAMLLAILCGCAQKAAETTEAAPTESQEAPSASPVAEVQEPLEAEPSEPDGPPQVEYTFPISDTPIDVSYYSSTNPTANITAENSAFLAKLGGNGQHSVGMGAFPHGYSL